MSGDLIQIRTRNGVVSVSKEFVTNCEALKKKKTELDTKVVENVYKVFERIFPADEEETKATFEVFKMQEMGFPLIHTNLKLLFKESELAVFNDLWNSGEFVDLIEPVEALKWNTMKNAMVIFYLCKVREANSKYFVNTFDVTEEQMQAIETKVINKLIIDKP